MAKNNQQQCDVIMDIVEEEERKVFLKKSPKVDETLGPLGLSP